LQVWACKRMNIANVVQTYGFCGKLIDFLDFV
jgi:hypothetical protein